MLHQDVLNFLEKINEVNPAQMQDAKQRSAISDARPGRSRKSKRARTRKPSVRPAAIDTSHKLCFWVKHSTTRYIWTNLLAQIRYTDKVYFINGWLILPSSAIKFCGKIVNIKLQ